MSEGNSGDVILSFLVGAAIGAAAALLLAPRTGEETRELVAEWLERNRTKAKEAIEKNRERIHRHG
jgi:gas vesicle protein